VDTEIRQARQREFTIILVLFILLVIVGAVGYQLPQNVYYYGGFPPGPYGFGGWGGYYGPLPPPYWATPTPMNMAALPYSPYGAPIPPAYGPPQLPAWW
jgi:uncharacterized protein (TIGR01732 family)